MDRLKLDQPDWLLQLWGMSVPFPNHTLPIIPPSSAFWCFHYSHLWHYSARFAEGHRLVCNGGAFLLLWLPKWYVFPVLKWTRVCLFSPHLSSSILCTLSHLQIILMHALVPHSSLLCFNYPCNSCVVLLLISGSYFFLSIPIIFSSAQTQPVCWLPQCEQ